jgi:hypothetical protein
MDAPESSPIGQTVPRKPQAYEALYWFNRSSEATLGSPTVWSVWAGWVAKT